MAITVDPVYAGACTKEDNEEFMGKNGFTFEGVQSKTQGQEENLTFTNDRFR